MKKSITKSGKKKFHYKKMERVTRIVLMPEMGRPYKPTLMQSKHGLPLIFEVAPPKHVMYIEKEAYEEMLAEARKSADAAERKLKKKASKEPISYYRLEKTKKTSRKIHIL